MNFPKIFKGLEGRSFLIQKFSLQIFVLKKENFGHEFREKLTIYFPKKGGGGGVGVLSKAVWNFSENSSVLVNTRVPYPSGTKCVLDL